MNDIFIDNCRIRGKGPEDDMLFGTSKQIQKLRDALGDMYYLLSRGYTLKSALVAVGGRWRLRARQLMALQSMACSAQQIEQRAETELQPQHMRGQTVYLDGFNILVLLETLLSGGYVFKGADGCYRDISTVDGEYKKINETEKVLILAGQKLQKLGVFKAVWVFDAPVANSGRLKALCQKVAKAYNFTWDILLDNAPDKYLARHGNLVCSSDAWVIGQCTSWFNFSRHVINVLYGEELPPNVVEIEV